MIDRNHPLPITRQAKAPNDGLGSTYRIGFSCPKKWGHFYATRLESYDTLGRFFLVQHGTRERWHFES